LGQPLATAEGLKMNRLAETVRTLLGSERLTARRHLGALTSPAPADVLFDATAEKNSGTDNEQADGAAASCFRKDGEYWTLAYEGSAFRLRDVRGLHYIAKLLSCAGREIHAIDLVSVNGRCDASAQLVKAPPAGEGLTNTTSDAGEVLDSQAREAYKRRLRELDAEIEEAQRFNDPGRVDSARQEIDFLTRELARAVGLGGRARRAGSNAERARINVTRSIAMALRKIAEHDSGLGLYLTRTIKTGTFCSYAPDPRTPIDWGL
jgi:hypothetical protein